MKCMPGTISSMSYECVPCNAEMGEYQDFEGGSFCKAVNPGFELDVNEDGTSGKPPNSYKTSNMF